MNDKTPQSIRYCIDGYYHDVELRDGTIVTIIYYGHYHPMTIDGILGLSGVIADCATDYKIEIRIIRHEEDESPFGTE